jgi:hypothetical protein
MYLEASDVAKADRELRLLAIGVGRSRAFLEQARACVGAPEVDQLTLLTVDGGERPISDTEFTDAPLVAIPLNPCGTCR